MNLEVVFIAKNRPIINILKLFNNLLEEKINKLKESTDSLRKELQLDTLDLNASTNSSSNNNSADKNQAASKIQNWYRENQSRRDSDKEDEIKKYLIS